MIPISDLKKQTAPLRTEIDNAIKEVIDNANFILGKPVQDFENDAAKYCRVRYAVGVSNGTDAIRLSLLASGIKYGDRVICPAFTYYATAGAIVSIGAMPVFADIESRTYNISVASIRDILGNRKAGSHIRAIIPVHLYGQCADMDSILEIANAHKLKVIEDAAQAFGAEYRGNKAGTMSDCAAVSFYPGKNLGAFGDAGMVLTNSRSVAQAVKTLRNQGDVGKYNHPVIGFNHRLDTLQAAVLRVKLRYLDGWNRKRQENAAYFESKLGGLNLATPFVPKYNTHIYHQYTLRLAAPSAKIIEHLRNSGIDARVYYPQPLHLQKCFKYLGYKKGDFPESERAAQQAFAIPVYPDLTKKELDYIIHSIKEFLR